MYRIIKRGQWYVPQQHFGSTWEDFTADAPGDPWMGFTSLPEAQAAIIAGPIVRAADVFVE